MKTNAANSVIADQVFQVLQPDGFFVPYGDIPHKKGLQKFDKASATEMQVAFNSVLGKLTNFFTGVPVYIGHPDVPECADKWPDKKAYGWVRDIEPREDGCFFKAAMNDAGRELIESKSFAYYSPFWDCKPVSGGIKPVWLRSIGLTNNPNILVPALANEAAAEVSTDNETKTTTTMLDKIMAALIAAGIVKEGDDENCVLKQIGNMISALAYERAEKEEQATRAGQMQAALSMENESDFATLFTATMDRISADNTKVATLMERVMTAENALTDAANEAAANDANAAREEARALLASARAHRIEFALENALATARLSPAERDTQREALTAIANDDKLTTALDALRAETPKLKTTTATAELGTKGKAISAANEDNAKGEQRRALVEECKKKFPNLEGGSLHEAAWNSARAQKPELFA